ncbi:MAG: polyprenyl synthetase family protein [Neisseriaceae bacterium]|nr:polyprenyl synthetase family protein [Neisseriaceae bacterium]
MKPLNFKAWQTKVQAQTEMALNRFLPSETLSPEILHQAMRYAATGGGKRLRAMLVTAAAELGRYDETALSQAIAAIEMIHAYSLIHDDLPCMDDDDMRRGKPSCHKAFGEAQALLAGDALQTLAFAVLSQDNALPAYQRLQSLRTLANASGSLGMAGGQSIDLSVVGLLPDLPALKNMHALKTGALIRASVRLGALACFDVADDMLQKLDDYAADLGLAFQVVDDILDAQADSQVLGKTAGKDAENNKPSFVSFMGIDAAKQYAHDLCQRAIHSVQNISADTHILQEMARFVLEREN